MPFGGLLTVGLISAGASLGSAAIGSSASKGAAKQLRADGIQVGGSIDKATGQAIQAGYNGLTQANSAMNTGLNNANGAINTGLGQSLGMVDAGLNPANQTLADVYHQEMGSLQPFQQAGTQGVNSLASALAPGGDLTRQFSASMMAQQDPGYAFRLSEGAKALANSQAARGSALSGGAMKAATRYGQDYSSNEYGNAFNRFQQSQAQRYNMLSGLAGFGERANSQGIQAGNNFGDQTSNNYMNWGKDKANLQTIASGQLSSNAMNAGGTLANIAQNGNQYIGNIGLSGAEAAGNAYMGAANAQAAGTIGSANAWSGALGGLGNTAMSLYTLGQLGQQGQGGGNLSLPYPNVATSDGSSLNPGGSTVGIFDPNLSPLAGWKP